MNWWKDVTTPDFSTPSFNPRLWEDISTQDFSTQDFSTPDFSTPDFSTMKFGVEKFIVEKSGIWRSGVEAWGWKVWGWNVLQPKWWTVATPYSDFEPTTVLQSFNVNWLFIETNHQYAIQEDYIFQLLPLKYKWANKYQCPSFSINH